MRVVAAGEDEAGRRGRGVGLGLGLGLGGEEEGEGVDGERDVLFGFEAVDAKEKGVGGEELGGGGGGVGGIGEGGRAVWWICGVDAGVYDVDSGAGCEVATKGFVGDFARELGVDDYFVGGAHGPGFKAVEEVSIDCFGEP